MRRAARRLQQSARSRSGSADERGGDDGLGEAIFQGVEFVSRYWRLKSARSLALFINGDNVTNQQVWMPDWGGNTGDTIPVNRGRTLYFGVEVTSNGTSGSPR